MIKKLTLKQTKFIKFYFDTDGNGVEAAKQAGYKGNKATLNAVAYENLHKPTILAAIEELKKKAGLTDEFLLKKHIQLINAKKFQSCDVYVSQEGGKYKVNENSNDFIEVDDNQVQIQALKLAYEINGKLIKKIEHSGEVKLTQEERNARIDDLKRIGILN
jgi:phage terminase small subunit